MKTKTLNIFCFLVPFVSTVFNLQHFANLISESVVRFIAYGNLALLITGIFINLNKTGTFSKTARLWIVFYITYYAFATLASAIHDNPGNILISIIPFIYVLAFYVYLSVPDNRKIFRIVAMISFTASSILCIYLFKINYDSDSLSTYYLYKLDRAEGVFGDANNAALVAVLSYIFIYTLYNPVKKLWKYFKIILLFTLFYCVFLTFSTTGLFVFVIINIVLNHKLFSPKRILLVFIIIPLFYIALFNINSLTANLNLSPHQQMKVNNIVNILTLNTSKVNDSGREELLSNLLNYVYKNPFIGNGIDFGISQHGHDTIVGIWADAGIFTLIIFLIMLISYFKNSILAPPNIRFSAISMLLTMCIFMLSLQSVINQPYLMALFVYIGYIIDEKKVV